VRALIGVVYALRLYDDAPASSLMRLIQQVPLQPVQTPALQTIQRLMQTHVLL
jgi:hypothetical protein